MSSLAPSRRAQASASLELANQIRSARAERRRRWRALGAPDACREAVDLVYHPAPWSRGWKVMRMLVAIPGVGPYRASRVLRGCHIPDNRVLGALDDRQRYDLVLWLEQRAESWRGSAG